MAAIARPTQVVDIVVAVEAQAQPGRIQEQGLPAEEVIHKIKHQQLSMHKAVMRPF